MKNASLILERSLSYLQKTVMQNWLRTLIAGYAGWKWGGGCLGFIAIFALVYFLLGKCN